ncbi:cation:proton antiporter [Piscinibacter gummiphilus]|uniref:Cation/H+ exchanger transmembrane domain-containing protein n=1 Tax=Piscinibacter gummiphilus TaxID=946333 RepID=A0A1W6LFJ8_9BURK|nr:cation:proton antiporter [Piscinibacter gummiphilus]ARN22993.1 hypothetical protein A4W93_25480 [Piscinibacter gummiphilus]ATU67695.1 hypothetical protein CPZ87_25615 [Piscinibacter gummiphilus]GLS96829.1 sodium:proton antiporter [Piscinibacter gummiphilus]
MAETGGVPSLLWVMLAAAMAPWLSDRLAALRLPVVALELLLGVLIGPEGLGLAAFDGALPVLARIGVALLFFLAGTEIDFGTLGGAPLRRGAAGWLLSLALAGAVAFGLAHLGFLHNPAVVALALSTTALGVIAPILRDAGLTGTPTGIAATACGVMGEVGPILLMSALFAGPGHQLTQVGLTALFAAIAVAVCWASLRIRPPGLLGMLARTMHRSGQWPVRVCMLLVIALVVLAENFGLDLALGAFAAGLAVGQANRNPRSEVLAHKLDAVGFGVMVPVFFVTSGMQLEVRALFAQPAALGAVALLTLLLLVVRGLPALVFLNPLTARETAAVGLYAATSLSLIVALTSAAVAVGQMTRFHATELVAAGLVSVLLFPWLAGLLLPPSRRSSSAPAPADAL